MPEPQTPASQTPAPQTSERQTSAPQTSAPQTSAPQTSGPQASGPPAPGAEATHLTGATAEIIARADTAAGEIVLRRRAGAIELVVNGVFAMDSTEITSELALADAAGLPPGRVLVGGLGLGYTAARLLDNGAERVDIAERARPLIEWAKTQPTDELRRLAVSPRVRLHHADIIGFVTSAQTRWDAIVLDVDNGPSFLIHDDNKAVYAEEFLTSCRSRVRSGGCLLVWCESASSPLEISLNRVFCAVESIAVPVAREGRDFNYVIYRARRA